MEKLSKMKIEVLGKIIQGTGKAPSVKVKLNNEVFASYILKNSNILKSKEWFNRVFIERDLTKEQRCKRKQLAAKLKEKISQDPTTHWKVTNGSIINSGLHKRNERTLLGNYLLGNYFSYDY